MSIISPQKIVLCKLFRVISNVNNITTENCSMQIVQSGSNVEIRITNVDTNDDSLQYNAYGYGTLTIDGKTLSDIRFIIEGSHY